MYVELLNYTREPERTVAAAARLCYSPIGAERILEDLTQEETEQLLNKLISMGHLSPLEHLNFTFGIEGVSRVLSHQMVRHRIASYSQKSQRYVEENNFEYIIPPSIARKHEANELFMKKMEDIKRAYQELAEMVHKEDARYILPAACETKLVATYNARSLLNFFELRCCNRAQWEIRRLALAMRDEVRKAAPIIFSMAGPKCETEGNCYEGKLSCGRTQNIKTRGR